MVQLNLTAANAKVKPPDELLTEFRRLFEREPVEAIQWTFRSWREKSGYFPAICDIRQLLQQWHRERQREAEEGRQVELRREEEKARAEGKMVGYAEIIARMAEVCKMPEPPSEHHAPAGLVRRLPPPIVLTKEQIAARRPAEREEIERYRRRMEEESDGAEK